MFMESFTQKSVLQNKSSWGIFGIRRKRRIFDSVKIAWWVLSVNVWTGGTKKWSSSERLARKYRNACDVATVGKRLQGGE